MQRALFWPVLLALLVAQAGAARMHASGAARQRQESSAGGLDPQTLSQLLVSGLDAITSAITIFTEDEPDIHYGIEILHLKFWNIIKKIVPKEEQDSEKMERAKKAWDLAFENAPDIHDDVMEFHDTGNTDSLMNAIKTLVNTGLESCSHLFPKQSVYFTSLLDLIDGLGQSWDDFAAGNLEKAGEAIWDATKKAVDDMIPDAVRDHEAYDLVMGTLDGVISKMSGHVLEYKRRMLESKVCYKRSQHRERARPSVCREGFEWDQGTLCLPKGPGHGADCFATCGRQAGMCESYCGKGRACCRREYPSDPAECEGATGFVDYSFTEGSSTDYHQCAKPGPNLAFTVSGAGTRMLNGLYVHSGTHSGKPRYVKVRSPHTIMEWSESRKVWRFFNDDTTFGWGRKTLYKSDQASPTFPTSGWVAESGLPGLPKLVPYTPDVSASLAQVNSSTRSAWWGDPYGSHRAACDQGSTFTEKSGGWCLSGCPAGFAPGHGTSCVQTCGGKFPADGTGVCGVNPVELYTAMSEMLTVVAIGVLDVYTIVDEMKKEGVHAEKLTKTIHTFIDMGKPFARPMCATESL